MYKPKQIHIKHLKDGDDNTKYGGKAASLWKLMKMQLSVPTAWVIPASECAKRPEIDFSFIDDTYGSASKIKFAVRSGAPVSMPGMMETKLNVDRAGLPEAINAVWDSWNSEHAKAYREAKGIPDDMGTAVILQFMVDATMSGVAFTSDPNASVAKAKFDPIIEYVNGLGDQLVGGTVTPTKMSKSNHLYETLIVNLQLIHHNHGPSDVEWCYSSNTGNLYFVQFRPVKFVVESNEPAIDDTGMLLLAKGEPIGSPKKVACFIMSANTGKLKPNDAVFVPHFKPEYYPLMIKSSAILCGTGGATCHASIIAREMDKPAIAGLTQEIIDTLSGGVLIDGATGKIYKHDAELKQAHSTTNVITMLDESRIPNPNLAKLSGHNYRFHVNLLLARFYATIEAWQNGKVTEERKQEVAKEIADLFCLYYFKASLGEMRHFNNMLDGYGPQKGAIAVTRRLSSLISSKIVDKGFSTPDRDVFVNGIQYPKTLKEAITTARFIEAGFNRFNWKGGYGGPAWGSIATALVKYLIGEYSPVMFVDICFNLRHNGGVAFNKFDWMTYNETTLNTQLYAKSVGDISQVLDAAVRSNVNHTEKIVKEFVERESIYNEEYAQLTGKTKAKTNEKQAIATAA